ncbi:hypothetical protein TESG_04355 [Trichophyton tonsurans CBS 112818]|uniref:Uncharacterized protein n=1 Tax=Trichophyton tonsurans (strain CBS 112818) TaxID=647933 RepID=F2S032_TRIT1|nr:hypothetical protein TESG_04355 [Trichophyton tonsurans CBS 112818]
MRGSPWIKGPYKRGKRSILGQASTLSGGNISPGYLEKDERFSPLRERDRVRVRGTYRIQLRRPAGRRPQIWGKEVETADPNHNRDPCYSIAPSQQRITLTGGQE